MKTKNVLVAIVFMAAIGGAFASEYLVATDAYSKKADVPGQIANCQFRGFCSNVTGPVCQITFDHDGDPNTSSITRDMWDSSCSVQLLRD